MTNQSYTATLTLEQHTVFILKQLRAEAASIGKQHVHRFTLTRAGRNVEVIAELRADCVTQAYVNDVAAHVRKVEADPVYQQPAPFRRY